MQNDPDQPPVVPRRVDHRRKAGAANYECPDRRAAEQRSGSDRRANPRI